MEHRPVVLLLLLGACAGSTDTARYESRSVELVDEGRLVEALALLDRALALQPERAALHLRRSNVLIRLGRDAEAQAAYDRYVDLQPYVDYPTDPRGTRDPGEDY